MGRRYNPTQEYIDSGSWRCEESPTGAHHWILTDKKRCKYCPEERPLPDISAPQFTAFGRRSAKRAKRSR